MSKKRRVPVRIQLWHENVKIDVRCWLDEFDVKRDTIETSNDFGKNKTYLPGGAHYTLRAHSGMGEAPWKFRKGRPHDAESDG